MLQSFSFWARTWEDHRILQNRWIPTKLSCTAMKMHGDVTVVYGDNKGNHPSLVVFRCSRSSSLAACPSPAQRHRAEPRVEPAAFPSPAQPYGQVSIFRHGSSGGLLLCRESNWLVFTSWDWNHLAAQFPSKVIDGFLVVLLQNVPDGWCQQLADVQEDNRSCPRVTFNAFHAPNMSWLVFFFHSTYFLSISTRIENLFAL